MIHLDILLRSFRSTQITHNEATEVEPFEGWGHYPLGTSMGDGALKAVWDWHPTTFRSTDGGSHLLLKNGRNPKVFEKLKNHQSWNPEISWFSISEYIAISKQYTMSFSAPFCKVLVHQNLCKNLNLTAKGGSKVDSLRGHHCDDAKPAQQVHPADVVMKPSFDERLWNLLALVSCSLGNWNVKKMTCQVPTSFHFLWESLSQGLNHSTFDLALRLGELRDAGFHMQVGGSRQDVEGVTCQRPMWSRSYNVAMVKRLQEDFDFFYLPCIPQSERSQSDKSRVLLRDWYSTLCHHKLPTYLWNRKAKFSFPNGLKTKHTCHIYIYVYIYIYMT